MRQERKMKKIKRFLNKIYRFFFPKGGFYASMQQGIVKGQLKGRKMRVKNTKTKVDANIMKQSKDIVGTIATGDKLGTKIAIINPTLRVWEQSIRDKLLVDKTYLSKITLDGEFAKAEAYYKTNKNITGLFKSMKITMDDVRGVMSLTLDKLNKEYAKKK